jgi:hypothetical protein
VPVYGQTVVVDSKHRKFGLVRQAKDPQKMYNYWTTALTESVALAPKAKWILAEGQDEGHENEWAQANIASKATLRYKQTDIDGRVAPPPIRQQPEAPPTGITTALQGLNADLMAVVGIYDPSQLPQGMQSGKAIQGQQMQVDMVNYHYFDNLTRSISHVGTIILDLVPKIYDTQRVMRIIGDDGKPDLVNINEPGEDEQGVKKILNLVPVGKPTATQFFRTHPSVDMQFNAMLLAPKGTQETYLMSQHVAGQLSELIKPVTLVLVIDRQSNLRLVPVPFPGGEGVCRRRSL